MNNTNTRKRSNELMYHISRKIARIVNRKYSTFRWSDSNNFYSYSTKKYEQKEISLNNLKERMESLSQVLEKEETLPKQYHTLPKDTIIKMLSVRCSLLSKDKYRSTRGENSTLLLGAKGIGKSSTLSSCCIALSTMSEKIIPIYLQYSCEEQNIPPSQALISNLKERGIHVKSNANMENLARTLVENDLHSLIVIDELDQLYQAKNGEIALQILDELSYIASSPSGAYCTIACGSSATLPLLITKNGASIPSVLLEYPLVAKSPNLNGSKFPSYRLGVGLMKDEEIEEIVKDVTETKEIKKEGINVFRFFCGPNVRRISSLGKLIKEGEGSRITNQIVPYDTQDVRAMKTLQEFRPLIEHTYEAMWEKNKKLIGKIDRNISIEQLLSIEWSNLQPIGREEIENIVKKCNSAEPNKDYNIKDFLRLVDTNWFTAEEDLSGMYPQTPFHLICYKIFPGHDKVREFAITALREVKKYLPEIVGIVL